MWNTSIVRQLNHTGPSSQTWLGRSGIQGRRLPKAIPDHDRLGVSNLDHRVTGAGRNQKQRLRATCDPEENRNALIVPPPPSISYQDSIRFGGTRCGRDLAHALLISLAVSLAQVIWFTGEQYDAGTFNRRLCMYRILSILHSERSKTAKVDFIATINFGNRCQRTLVQHWRLTLRRWCHTEMIVT